MLRPALLMITVALCAAGCSSTKPVAWNIVITKPAPIEVDLVAVTAREKPRFETYPLDKYWSPNDDERKTADKITSEPTDTWKVSKKDKKWEPWLNRRVIGLFVIANLPGNFDASPDPRREYLPIDKKHWDAQDQTLEIEVKENRIIIRTPEEVQ